MKLQPASAGACDELNVAVAVDVQASSTSACADIGTKMVLVAQCQRLPVASRPCHAARCGGLQPTAPQLPPHRQVSARKSSQSHASTSAELLAADEQPSSSQVWTPNQQVVDEQWGLSPREVQALGLTREAGFLRPEPDAVRPCFKFTLSSIIAALSVLTGPSHESHRLHSCAGCGWNFCQLCNLTPLGAQVLISAHCPSKFTSVSCHLIGVAVSKSILQRVSAHEREG